jgi:pantoate--beta-alanine ligase
VVVVDRPGELKALLDAERARGKTVGFFPTKGVRHGGHCADIAKMAAECDVAVVGIYPGAADLGRRAGDGLRASDLAVDLARAEAAGATVAFVPPAQEVAPDGVASTTARLLSLAAPCYAYFGEKDYERLLAVRKVVKDLSLPAAVVACPTVREPDGLALSSCNGDLSVLERAAASAFYWALLAGKRAVDESGETDAGAVRAAMAQVLARPGMVDVEQAQVVDPGTLGPVGAISGEVRLVVAGRIGRHRLVDNVAARRQEA